MGLDWEQGGEEPGGFCLGFSPIAESLNQVPRLLSRFLPRVKSIGPGHCDPKRGGFDSRLSL